MGLMENLPLQGERAAAYSLEEQSLLCDHLDVDDQMTGVLPTRFCSFVSQYVICVYIAAGEKKRQTLISFLLDCLLPKLAAVPRKNLAPCYSDLEQRIRAVLFLIGDTPGLGESNLKHVDFLKNVPTNEIMMIVKATKWTKTILDTIYAVNAGVKTDWPHVQDWMVHFNAKSDIEKYDLIVTMANSYASWDRQCRLGAIQITIHVPVLKWSTERLKENMGASGIYDATGEKILNADDTENVKLLELYRTLKALDWTETEVNSGLRVLGPLAKVLAGRTNKEKIVQVCRDFDFEAHELGSGAIEFSAALQLVIPAEATSVRITATADRELCATAFSTFGDRCLLAWPNDDIFDTVTFIVLRCEVPKDPPVESEITNAKLCNFKTNLIIFRRLQGLHKHLRLWNSLAEQGLSSELVEDEKFVEVSKKLLAYQAHFTNEFGKTVLADGTVTATFESTISATTDKVAHFKALYVTNIETIFRSALKELQASAGGTEPPSKWHDGVGPDVSWPTFLSNTKDTLRKVDKVPLIHKIRATDPVRLGR